MIQRLDYPQYVLEVDQAKASAVGLTQTDVMQNVVAAFNSSIQFNKRNFWIDPKSSNQYYVGVQYPEESVTSLDTLLDVPITGPGQKRSIPLRTIATLRRTTVPSEINHTNLQAQIDLTMGVHGRDLGHVAEDVNRVLAKYGKERPDGGWTPIDPDAADGKLMEGSRVVLAGEYQKMRHTFRYQAMGMVGAVLLIYFLMVALFKSYLTPLVVLSAVPIGLIGVVLVLFLTGTALNVQSLLGVIFMVGIVVSNTVLLDRLRGERAQGRPRDADGSDPAGRGDPRAPDPDDDAGDVLRAGADVAGAGARERGERAARPRGPRRAGRGTARPRCSWCRASTHCWCRIGSRTTRLRPFEDRSATKKHKEPRKENQGRRVSSIQTLLFAFGSLFVALCAFLWPICLPSSTSG